MIVLLQALNFLCRYNCRLGWSCGGSPPSGSAGLFHLIGYQLRYVLAVMPRRLKLELEASAEADPAGEPPSTSLINFLRFVVNLPP